MTVSSIAEGAIQVGHAVAGAVPGTVVRADVSGGGDVGEYLVTPAQNIPAGRTLASSFWLSTKWVALSAAAPGEVVKISGWSLG